MAGARRGRCRHCSVGCSKAAATAAVKMAGSMAGAPPPPRQGPATHSSKSSAGAPPRALCHARPLPACWVCAAAGRPAGGGGRPRCGWRTESRRAGRGLAATAGKGGDAGSSMGWGGHRPLGSWSAALHACAAHAQRMGATAARLGLVLHQRNERRHHEHDARPHGRHQRVAERLASSCTRPGGAALGLPACSAARIISPHIARRDLRSAAPCRPERHMLPPGHTQHGPPPGRPGGCSCSRARV